MRYNHIGIPTTESFDGEIDLPHLKVTVSDHTNNPFGIQWQRYWDDAPYPEIVRKISNRMNHHSIRIMSHLYFVRSKTNYYIYLTPIKN